MISGHVAEPAVCVRPDLDRSDRACVTVEVVGEAIVGRDELGPAVSFDVVDRRTRARVPPEVDDGHVALAHARVAVDADPGAAMRPARVELEHHLRIAVAVEIAHFEPCGPPWTGLPGPRVAGAAAPV